jgi:hypothetical protein
MFNICHHCLSLFCLERSGQVGKHGSHNIETHKERAAAAAENISKIIDLAKGFVFVVYEDREIYGAIKTSFR